MKSTSGRFSALIIFDGTIAAIQQRCDNKPVVPLVYNGTILPRKAPFWAFCGDLPGGSHQPLFPGGDFKLFEQLLAEVLAHESAPVEDREAAYLFALGRLGEMADSSRRGAEHFE